MKYISIIFLVVVVFYGCGSGTDGWTGKTPNYYIAKQFDSPDSLREQANRLLSDGYNIESYTFSENKGISSLLVNSQKDSHSGYFSFYLFDSSYSSEDVENELIGSIQNTTTEQKNDFMSSGLQFKYVVRSYIRENYTKSIAARLSFNAHLCYASTGVYTFATVVDEEIEDPENIRSYPFTNCKNLIEHLFSLPNTGAGPIAKPDYSAIESSLPSNFASLQCKNTSRSFYRNNSENYPSLNLGYDCERSGVTMEIYSTSQLTLASEFKCCNMGNFSAVFGSKDKLNDGRAICQGEFLEYKMGVRTTAPAVNAFTFLTDNYSVVVTGDRALQEPTFSSILDIEWPQFVDFEVDEETGSTSCPGINY